MLPTSVKEYAAIRAPSSAFSRYRQIRISAKSISPNEKENAVDTQKELLFGIYSKPNAVLITVDDTGLGISPENIKQIFENGYSTKGKNRGTGLYQVKTMVDNLGGQITVESQENVGTSFSVSFSK